MNSKANLVLIAVLLLGGVALLLVGQAGSAAMGAGTWSLAAGLLLLVGAAALASRHRQGRKEQAPLVGEYRGVLASEEGFVPIRGQAEEQRQQAQRRIVGKPERAAESVRGMLGDQVRQAKPSRGAAGPRQDLGKRRKGDG